MADGSNLLIPTQRREAFFRAASVDEKSRTVEIVWTTGAMVLRRRFSSDDFDEELVVTQEAVRLDRLNNGAPFLNAHCAIDLDDVIGVVVEGSAKIKGGEGVATIRFSERADVEPIFKDIRGGIIRNVSVGYRVHKYEIEKRDGERDIWRAVDWEPYEISAVPIGADPGAQFRNADREEKYPVAIVRRDLNAASPANVKGNEMADGQNMPAQTPDEIRASERARVKSAFEIARSAGLGDAWAHRMVEQGAAEDLMRRRALEAIAERTNDGACATVADSFSGLRGSGSDFETSPIEEYFEARISSRSVPAVVANEIDGRRFVDAARYYLRRNGENVGMMNDARIIGLALGRRSFAAQGTGDFSILLENAMHKTLLKRLEREPSGIKRVAFKGTAGDFRPQNRYRGGTFPKLQKYNEHGEIKTGVLPDGARESITLQSQGSIVRLTRQALVNDDLSALSDFTVLAAEGIEATIAAQLAAIVEAPPNLSDGNPVFHASRANIGDDSALSETSLGAGKLAMRKFVDINGEIAGITPKYLVVPPELEVAAQKLLSAVQAAKTSDVNPFAGTLELVVEARLTDSAKFYLVADQEQVRGLEYCFLDGSEGGIVETKSGWETDGIEIRSILDLGVAFIDPRGWWISG